MNLLINTCDPIFWFEITLIRLNMAVRFSCILIPLYPIPFENNSDKNSNTCFISGWNLLNCHLCTYDPCCFLVVNLHDERMILVESLDTPWPMRVSPISWKHPASCFSGGAVFSCWEGSGNYPVWVTYGWWHVFFNNVGNHGWVWNMGAIKMTVVALSCLIFCSNSQQAKWWKKICSQISPGQWIATAQGFWENEI